MTRLIAFALIAFLAVAALTVSEHSAPNAGLPLVKTSTAQGDMARANTLLSPCPLSPQNLPPTMKEERA